MGATRQQAPPLSQTTTRCRLRLGEDPTLLQVRRALISRAAVLSRLRGPSGAGVLFARPLVGSRWTAGQGPLAQKTPTPLTPSPVPPGAGAQPSTLWSLA